MEARYRFPLLSFANPEFFPTIIDSPCFELWNPRLFAASYRFPFEILKFLFTVVDSSSFELWNSLEASYRFLPPFFFAKFLAFFPVPIDLPCFELSIDRNSPLSLPSCRFPPSSLANPEFLTGTVDWLCFELPSFPIGFPFPPFADAIPSRVNARSPPVVVTSNNSPTITSRYEETPVDVSKPLPPYHLSSFVQIVAGNSDPSLFLDALLTVSLFTSGCFFDNIIWIPFRVLYNVPNSIVSLPGIRERDTFGF